MGSDTIIDAAEKEKDGLIKFCGVALNHLFGNMAKCKHEAPQSRKPSSASRLQVCKSALTGRFLARKSSLPLKATLSHAHVLSTE